MNKPINVVSPSKKIHRAKADKLITECGAIWIDLFATYEYGISWPETNTELTCKNCIRILKNRAQDEIN